MHAIAFLQDLAVVMIVAGVVSVLFHHFKQPVVLGYILAGVIIGPHTPPAPLIHDEETIKTLADLGMVFLMFSLGLEFSLGKLKKVGATAFIASSLEILLMVFAGYEVGQLFGWSRMDSIFLGAMLSISSTTIIIKALGELGKSKERFASLIFGILIVEDILAIVMIALLSGIAMTGTLHAADVAATLGKLGIFLVTTLVVGLIAVPRLLSHVGKSKSNEMLLVTVLGLCFGVSLLAARLGYSVALGAFIIGAVMAECRELGRIERLMEPIRDMFSAVFFVAIGLLIQPKMLVEYALPILVITIVVVVGKVITCAVGTFVAGHSTRTSLKVGMGLSQIGEFSFIIASLGLTLKVTSEFLYPIAVTVSAITTLLTPYLIKSADSVVDTFDRVAPKALVNNLAIYTRRVAEISAPGPQNLFRKILKRAAVQIMLNAVLISAVFLASAYVAKHPPAWLATLLSEPLSRNTALWLLASIGSLPLFIASYRKLHAVGMMIAEAGLKGTPPTGRTVSLQGIISLVITWVGMLGLVLLVLALSPVLLPPARILVILGIALGLIAWLMWHRFVRVYSKAQIALNETLSENFHEPEPEQTHLPTILKNAVMETLVIAEGNAGTGKMIRELELRSRTGATIVGISRQGATIINPGPDEELLLHDEVVLIGSRDHLTNAKALLGAPVSPAGHS